MIPNSDGPGIVDQVGGGVSGNLLGKRVGLFNGQRLGRAFGTGAEYICITAVYVSFLPNHASFDEGATLGIPGLTAYHSVFSDGPVLGKTVLVAGGAGAVGFYAISLAAWGGANVLSTVSTREKSKIALQAGAKFTINYKEEDVANRVLHYTNGTGIDRVISVDFGGDLKWLGNIMRQNSCVTAYASISAKAPRLPFFQFMRPNIQIRPFVLNSLPKLALNASRHGINQWLLDQKSALQPIAKTLPLEKIIEAHEFVEAGSKFGTVIVNP